MRIRIIFSLQKKGVTIPFHHQYLLNDLINDVCSNGSIDDFDNFQLRTFSGLKGQTKVSRNGLRYYSNKVTLVFSSISKEYVDYFLDQLFLRKTLELGEMILSPEFVEKETDHEWKEAEKFVCLSPILLSAASESEADEDHPIIDPFSEEFSDIIYDAVINKMELSALYTLSEIESFNSFQVVPDKGYIEKMKKQQKKYSRVFPIYVDGVAMFSRGYTIPFTLFAHKRVQEFVYQTGIGLTAHKGFGMVDFANVDPNKVINKYKVKEEVIKPQ